MFILYIYLVVFLGGGKTYSQSVWEGAWPRSPLDPPLHGVMSCFFCRESPESSAVDFEFVGADVESIK